MNVQEWETFVGKQRGSVFGKSSRKYEFSWTNPCDTEKYDYVE